MRLGRLALWTCLGLLAVGCPKKAERARSRPPAAAVSDKPALLATLPDEAGPARPSAPGKQAPQDSKPPVAMDHRVPDAPAPGAELQFHVAERGGGVAWQAPAPDGKVRVFHNGTPGPAFDQVGMIALSPDGAHCAYGATAGERNQLVVDGKPVATHDTIDATTYSPDGAHLFYECSDGNVHKFVLDGEVLSTAPNYYLAQDFGADSNHLWFVEVTGEEKSRMVVADVRTRKLTEVDRQVRGGLSSPDRWRVATRELGGDGHWRVLSFDVDHPEEARRGKPYEALGGMEFGPGGRPLAYFALRAGQTFLVVDEEEIPVPPGDEVVGGAAPRPGQPGFGLLVRRDGKVGLRYHPPAAGAPEPAYDDAVGLAYGTEGRSHAYAARRGEAWFVVVDGKEGPPFDIVLPPQFTPGGKLVYRARRNGRRLVVVAGPDGKTLRESPGYDQVFDVHVTADGKSIAYGVKDGRRIEWKVEPLP